jgi:hypothetical protein
MKIGILTAYTDTNKWTSDGTCDFMHISSKNHIDYCYRNNYSYICELFKDEDYVGYHPTWIKLFAIKKHLPNYDYVVWIDSDCVVTDLNVRIEKFITDTTYIIIPKSEKDYTTNIVWTGVTTGFMIFKNVEKSYTLLDTIITESNNYSYDYFHEQSVLDNYLRSNGYYNSTPPLLYNLDEDLTDIVCVDGVGIIPYKYHRCLDDGVYSFIYHAGGNSLTKKSRLENVLKSLC